MWYSLSVTCGIIALTHRIGNNIWRGKTLFMGPNLPLSEMNAIVISVCGGEWVFQKVEELSGLFSNVSYLFSTGTTQDTVSSCFQYCALSQECNVVITTNSECYCSKYPTNDTYSTSAAKSTVDRKVYFKRPVRGKWFIISIPVQSNIWLFMSLCNIINITHITTNFCVTTNE